jgi:hypothetical protein
MYEDPGDAVEMWEGLTATRRTDWRTGLTLWRIDTWSWVIDADGGPSYVNSSYQRDREKGSLISQVNMACSKYACGRGNL